MSPPQELIERLLSIHGDALFRAALLLAGDEKGAERLLRGLVGELLTTPPVTPPDEVDLLARLLAVARADEAKKSGRRPEQARPAADLPAIYRSLFALPADQRLAVGLHLLLGYDVARLVRVLASDEAAARAGLIAAMRAIAPAARISLTDRTSSDHCLSVRDALVDPAGRLRHAPAIRGHLATCSHCRAFDLAWGELSQAVETALRTALRERDLPPALEARLLALARPARRFNPHLRFALPPLVILLIIAALVLPGITRRSVTVVDREAAAPVDPQALISRSLDMHTRPPEAGGPIWHARYQTFWYFDNTTLAPLHAEIWLDRTNPARHRMQLTHAAGGAPYELQLGNGTDRLYYALDGLYARALYGSLPLRPTEDAPALISEVADSPAQSRAFADRVSYGVWNIPPFYLNQAKQAVDLRVLGRQRDGDRTVQIISFSGISPVGHPADSPGATAERVTVLLALDLVDGRLRTATELAGPAGGTQTSRVTWKLLSEDSFGSGSDAGQPFDIGRAWNGRGEFPDARGYRSADPAVPLISAASLSDPALLLSDTQDLLWLPATPPAGVERALLVWPSFGGGSQGAPQALIYLGPDRRLIMRFNAASRVAAAEEIASGPWEARLEPGRSRTYRVSLQRAAAGRDDPSSPILIDAHGFSRADLLAVIESLRPLDAAILSAQDTLFARPGNDSPAARTALFGLLGADLPAQGMVAYQRLVRYERPGPVDPRDDPYHVRSLPETALYETWSVGPDDGGATLLRISDPDNPASYRLIYSQGGQLWSYDSLSNALGMWRLEQDTSPEASNLLWLKSMGLLSSPGDNLRIEQTPDGSLIARSSPIEYDSREYWQAIQAAVETRVISAEGELLRTTELQLDADGLPVEVRTLVGPGPDAPITILYEASGAKGYDQITLSAQSFTADVLIETLQQIERGQIALAEAPPELRSGQPPQALIVRDYRVAPPQSSIRVTPDTPAEALSLTGSPYYALPEDLAQIESLEVSLGGPAANSVPFDLGESPLMTAVGVGLASRTIYSVARADGGDSFPAQIIQGQADLLGAFLASAEYVPWDRSTLLRLEVDGRQLDVWEASGFGAHYLIAEVDGQLLIVIVSSSVPVVELYSMIASLRLVE